MKNKIVLFLLIISLVAASGAFAQASASGGKKGAAKYDLTVTSNVSTAQVFINGAAQNNKGMPFTAAGLAPGSYTIVLKAAGYQDGSATVNLAANQSVNINLSHLTAGLTVTSNVSTAQVFINDAAQNNKGMPFSATLNLGTYTIGVKAPGYKDGSATVNLSTNQTVNINLELLMATVIAMKPHPDFKVFVDGSEITEPRTVPPGKHTVRYSIGALIIEQSYTFDPGKVYKFEPVLSLKFTN